MSADALWWTERNFENVPRARWFGIFRRSVKLSEDIPQRLSIPSAILSAPRHVSPSDDNLNSRQNYNKDRAKTL